MKEQHLSNIIFSINRVEAHCMLACVSWIMCFWRVLRVVPLSRASVCVCVCVCVCERESVCVCVCLMCVCFPAAAEGLVPFNPCVSFICLLPYRKPQRSGSAVDGLFGVNRDLWEKSKSERGQFTRTWACGPSHVSSTHAKERGKKGGGGTLVFDTGVNKEWRLLKTTEH